MLLTIGFEHFELVRSEGPSSMASPKQSPDVLHRRDLREEDVDSHFHPMAVAAYDAAGHASCRRAHAPPGVSPASATTTGRASWWSSKRIK